MDESYILYVRNELGEFVPIPAIKGDKGAQGDKGDTVRVKYRSVTLEAALWSGDASPYIMTFDIDGVDAETLVSFALTADNIMECYNGDYALAVVNNNGVVTFYAIGSKPTSDIETNVTLWEVTA